MTDLQVVKEYYEHRSDKLNMRVHNHRSGWVNEHFHPGRSKNVKGMRVRRIVNLYSLFYVSLRQIYVHSGQIDYGFFSEISLCDLNMILVLLKKENVEFS